MGVHPDLTAFRAVDACGGAYSPEEQASGFAAGHKAALDAACEAVKAADERMGALVEAAAFSAVALATLTAFEADWGEPVPDDYEIGRISESRESASFRLRAGHIRRLAAALAKATGQ